MKTTILSHLEELKTTATRTGLLYSDDKVMFAYFKDIYFRLESIEKLIELENELHLTEVGDAVKELYNQDTELTHIQIDLQVRKVQSEKKKAVLTGKLYI